MLYRATAMIATALLATAGLVERQAPSSAPALSAPSGSTVQVITTSLFPGGVSPGYTALVTTIPLVCLDGCFAVATYYEYCFLQNTFLNGTTVGAEPCNNVCNQTNFNGITQCLNCIVANGDERPYGYTNNTSLTALPSATNSAGGVTPQAFVGATLINATVANGWLRNMTNLCSSRGTNVTAATSITAVPTTTGPYQASWTSGQTISRTQWLGLSQYPPRVYTSTRTIGIAALASESSRGAGMSTVEGAPLRWVMGGALLAWAVL